MMSRLLNFAGGGLILLVVGGGWLASPLLAATAESQFAVKLENGAIVSLKRADDKVETDYMEGRRLGDVNMRYRTEGSVDWQAADTAALARNGGASFSTNATGNIYKGDYSVTNGDSAALAVEMRYAIQERAIIWTMTLRNLGGKKLEIGDLAVPLSIGARSPRLNGTNTGPTGPVVLKHSFVSGNGSYLFWMRSTVAGPNLMMLPTEGTQLEYWQVGQNGGYQVFIHSAAAGATVKERGAKWRQPNTSLTLAPKGNRGDSQTYGFKFCWANDYDDVRQILVDDGKIDVQVVPGMTVPADLFAEFALRTKQKIKSVEAEFPKDTSIESLGRKGNSHIYKVKFFKLGENELTIHYGDNQHMVLEFFSTEPLETLIKKRAAFLAKSQHRDPAKWYNGLITEWNMDSRVLLSPDNYDRIRGFRIYDVTCDDAGLGRPAYLAAKNAEFPAQKEVEALDYYIKNFVWGGLQRTTQETYPYGVYGIEDWKTNRMSADTGRNGQLHIWREYDYPHVILMYFSMYRIAANHPEIKMAMSAKEYLARAYGTANAMFTVPHEIYPGWSPYGTGFYNELVIVDLIDALAGSAMKTEADTLRAFWERKVKNFVNRDQDLFRSEYAFDSTGFESTHAMAKYALEHEGAGINRDRARGFLEKQLAGNLFCRGALEPAYYLLGSDYRGSGGNAYTLTYMSQMGGWGVLDYALNFATNAAPYLRLGYQSYLSAWALVNSGTPESHYGYWYPGADNDGGAGGGFEPAPSGQTWLGQPHHRGSWFYSGEIDLGFSGGLRDAATVLTDDPIFGLFCYGGEWKKKGNETQIVPRDGVRRRFYARRNEGKINLILENDRFQSGEAIEIKNDFSSVRFAVESDNPEKHVAVVRFSAPSPGEYELNEGSARISTIKITDNGVETRVELPIKGGAGHYAFTMAKTEGERRK